MLRMEHTSILSSSLRFSPREISCQTLHRLCLIPKMCSKRRLQPSPIQIWLRRALSVGHLIMLNAQALCSKHTNRTLWLLVKVPNTSSSKSRPSRRRIYMTSKIQMKILTRVVSQHGRIIPTTCTHLLYWTTRITPWETCVTLLRLIRALISSTRTWSHMWAAPMTATNS